ncbi:siderophore-interacting protein [Gordonia spumicola]|uniref:Siderophore-interacting protein n=1 Tax=Gordonia spumicola TaxID=589161 RepID=A0A7I9VC08_9ACTN|nr:siderophore-interacting protein [Gordonia spumicola]GEE02909.1 siderophore-interacting protein [Gordonia spumicola]
MPEHRVFPAVVTSVADLGASLRRITVAAPELASHRPIGPDEYIGLLMPRDGRPLVVPPPGEPNIRAAISTMSDDDRPDLRWYTIRRARPEACEIDIDIVVHGDHGPGTRFARRARIGSTVGVRESSALYTYDSCVSSRLLVGDETAIPAIARILESTTCSGPTTAIIETADPADRLVDGVQWVDRTDVPGEGLERAVRATPLGPALDLAWVCGERDAVKRIRRHLVDERSVDRTAVTFSGYWRLGQARG